ncbi:MAG: ABC transporter permease [Anaerolineales bacterium]|nr:ABC transporter permease [Anaerolineales bacterium]
MDLFSINEWLSAAIRMSAPLMLVGVGGVFTERTGVFNIGMEGTMLIGCMTAVYFSLVTGNLWVATFAAMAVGGVIALVHAFLTVTRRADQIVTGAAINLFGLGITNLLNGPLYADFEYRPRVPMYPVVAPEVLQNLPIIGPILFAQPVIVYFAFLLPIIATWILYRTSWGLNVRAVGDHPHAVATAGLSVIGLKYVGVIISGMASGLGGAALTLADLGLFAPGMTGGRGFVVLAALIVGKWNPIFVAAACILFGAADALQLRAQTVQLAVPYQIFVMLPYLLTIAALAGLVGRTVSPKTAGIPYDPESI